MAVASSRLEGGLWDGAVTLLTATSTTWDSTSSNAGGHPTVHLQRETVHGTEYGIPCLTWCGPDNANLAVGQDNGDVEVRHSGLIVLPPRRLMTHIDTLSLGVSCCVKRVQLTRHEDRVLACTQHHPRGARRPCRGNSTGCQWAVASNGRVGPDSAPLEPG